MDLNEVLVFVRVVQAGSFNKAGAQLNMPNSTVSAKVNALEKRLGVTLLHRTTRKLNLTQVGEVFFQNSLKHIEGLISAESEASLNQSVPRGTLRVTSPVLFASNMLPEVISKYIEMYPEVDFELMATDETVDLISQNIDLAIRAGKLIDSSLKTRKLGVSHFAPFASPSYIKRHPKITHPKNLLEHDCIQFTPVGKEQWEFINKVKNKITISMKKRILLNELNVVKEMAINGNGIALLPTFVCENEVEGKDLVRVLTDWKSESRDISFVYPADRYLAPKVSAFLELAGDIIKKRLASLEEA